MSNHIRLGHPVVFIKLKDNKIVSGFSQTQPYIYIYIYICVCVCVCVCGCVWNQKFFYDIK